MMAIDLQFSDMRDESLQSKHLWFVWGFEATVCVLIIAVIGHLCSIHIPDIFQEFMDFFGLGPSVFLDKSGRSKGLCLRSSKGPWLNFMMVAHGYNYPCYLIIFRGLFKHLFYLSWGTILGARKHRFSGTNQKAERRRPFGTGLVWHCPQGLFSPFFTFLCDTFFRPFRLSLVPTICPWVSEDAWGTRGYRQGEPNRP